MARKYAGFGFCLYRLSGLFPYDDFGKYSSIYAAFSVSLHLLFTGLHFSNYFYLKPTLSIGYTIIVLKDILLLIPVWTHVCVMIAKEKRFQYILRSITIEITRTNKITITFFTVMYIVIIIYTFYVTWNRHTFKILFSSIVPYHAYSLFNFFLSHQYSSLLKSIQKEFAKLSTNSPYLDDRVRKHSKILNVLHKTVEHYQCQILPYILLALINSAQPAFWFLTVPSTTGVQMIFLAYSLTALVGLQMTCFSCEQTKAKADAFHRELFKIIRGREHLSGYNKHRLYAITSPTVTFTACGFFSLGNPLMASLSTTTVQLLSTTIFLIGLMYKKRLIAAATSYIVILIQFTEMKG